MTPEQLRQAIISALAENEALVEHLRYRLIARAQDREGQRPLFCASCGYPDQGELEQDGKHCPSCGSVLMQQAEPPLPEPERLTADQPPTTENFLKPSRRSGGRLDGRHIEQRKPYKKARLL